MDNMLDPYRALEDRDLAAEGLLIAEGPYLAERLLASPLELHSVVCREDLALGYRALAAGRCPVHVLETAEMSRLVGFRFHRGVLACGRRPAPADPEALLRRSGPGLLVVCPALNDDANVGLVIRSAVAFGATGVLLGPGCADPYGRRSLRLSMGASLIAPLARYTEAQWAADRLRAAGYVLMGTANRPEAVSIGEVRRPERVAVLIGNEDTGLDRFWLDRCEIVARIPMDPRLDSLGASVAAGIALFVLSRPTSPDAAPRSGPGAP